MFKFNAQNIDKFISNQEILNYFEKNKDRIQKTLQGEDKYHDVLGWHTVKEWMGEKEIKAIEKKAKEIKENATAFVLIGIGGSNQAARAVITALNPLNGIEIIYAGNTLSAYELSKLENNLKNKDFYINIIAKNFETLEPGASFRLLRSLLTKQYGEKSHKKIIVTTTICRKRRQRVQRHLPYCWSIFGRLTFNWTIYTRRQ